MKISVKVTVDNAKDHEIVELSRIINKDSDINIVLGEILYGAEIQCHKFNTGFVYDKICSDVKLKFKAGKGQVRTVEQYAHGNVVIFIKIV